MDINEVIANPPPELKLLVLQYQKALQDRNAINGEIATTRHNVLEQQESLEKLYTIREQRKAVVVALQQSIAEGATSLSAINQARIKAAERAAAQHVAPPATHPGTSPK